MATVGRIAVLVIALVFAIGLTHANVIRLDEANSLDLKPDEKDEEMENFLKLFMEYFKPPTVGHFATHNLCGRLRQSFEGVMKKKLLRMSDSFVTKFVDNLCDRKPHVLLRLWVSELFDADSDGYVDEHEKYNVIDHNYDD